MKMSIIGSNGYIASNFVNRMTERNCLCYLYDKDENPKKDFDHYSQLNVLDKNSVENMKFDVDAILIFAGITGTLTGFEEYEKYIQVNEIGLLNILDAYVKAHSTARIIFPSTRLVYKGAERALTEEAPKEFKTIYAANKYICEQYLKMYASMYGIKYSVLRIGIPFDTDTSNVGAYGTMGFLVKRAQKKENICVYGNGSQKRTFTHIEDLCEVLYRVSVCDACVNEIYNVGGDTKSISDVAEMIAKVFGVKVDYVKWPEEALKIESGSTFFDSNKLDKVLNYKYKLGVADFIKQLESVKREENKWEK